MYATAGRAAGRATRCLSGGLPCSSLRFPLRKSTGLCFSSRLSRGLSTLDHQQQQSQKNKRRAEAEEKKQQQQYSKVHPHSKKISVLVGLKDREGALQDVLKYFWKFGISLTRIESRPSSRANDVFDFYVDFEGHRGDPPVEALLAELNHHTVKLEVLQEKVVPWFPTHISELDHVANRTLDAGIDLQSDHPGFNDEEYRERRNVLAQVAQRHRCGSAIPFVQYTQQEEAAWREVWDAIEPLHARFACREYLDVIESMKRYLGLGRGAIPQQQDVSDFLHRRTGFVLRPVAGLLSSRDFLNGLAFRTFFSTQYIRHHSRPLYTPEPDICHELLGHAPMFADPNFSDFSQEVGLASLGASDEDIVKLARCYWFSVEFGVLKQQDGEMKAYGAGLLSSFGELEYACSSSRPTAEGGMERPVYAKWDPRDASEQDFPITSYQPKYFVAEGLRDATDRMREYCTSLNRPFYARYNPLSGSIWVDRAFRAAALDTTGPPASQQEG